MGPEKLHSRSAECGSQNYGEAVKWYRKAAEQGDAGAQYQLGIMYEIGRSVPSDYVEAYKWFKLAADHGQEYAAELLSSSAMSERLTLLSSIMTPVQLQEGAHFVQLNQVELVLAAPIAGGGIPAGGSDVVWSFHVFSVFYLPPDMPATARIRSVKISEKRLAGI